MKKASVLIFFCLLVISCKEKTYKDKIYTKPEIVRKPASTFLSPEESMKTFYLPEGYKVELVASEPMINEPVAIAWDGNGIMYVAQMETYVQNIDGDGTMEPTSRIMRLEDLDGDGKMDKSTVFIDSLLLPRMILPLDGVLIVNETNSYDLWSYKDTNNDGVADEKKIVYKNKNKRGGNLEHQQSGLLWNLDNWVYTTYNPYRFKFTKEGVKMDTLDNMPTGQWGLTQDDMGTMYYSAAGGENPAYGFQYPPPYGEYNPPGRLSPGFMEPWPIVGTLDVQGGIEHRTRKDGTLNHFTGVAGQEIFRGDRLPPSVYGDLFIPEPVGRLIRRAKVKTIKGKKVLYNAYHEAEFMASTDLNFRPVQAKTGPDGALYIVDMYRGIIQESNWTRKGSKMRPVILEMGLDKNIGKGRIYRIVHEDIKPDKIPALLDKSAQELITYLGHPNGWYRNTAQKLIILKGDPTVFPELKEIARDNESIWSSLFGRDKDFGIQRVHALWTLEGLGEVDKELIVVKFSDEDARVRMTAIRLSETFLRKGDTEILVHLEKLLLDNDKEVVNQVALSLRFSKDKRSHKILEGIGETYAAHEIISHSVQESLKEDDLNFNALKNRISTWAAGDRKKVLKGFHIYKQLCVTCHGADLTGVKNENSPKIAPSLIGSARVMGDKERLSKLVLNGLIGPVDGIDYGIMMPLKANTSDWIANVLSYIRAMNDSGIVSNHNVSQARKKSKDREDYWTLKELNK